MLRTTPQLEGAVQAGEGRVRAQAAELEATKARARELEAQLEAAQVRLPASLLPFHGSIALTRAPAWLATERQLRACSC